MSTTQLVLGAVVGVFGAILGYRLSENDRRVLGRTPWGLPSALWAFFWFILLPLGVILYLIAHSEGVRQFQQQSPPDGSAAAPSSPPGPVSAADLFPAYPRPANAPIPTSVSEQSTPVFSDSGTGAIEEPDPGQAVSGGSPYSPPAWHPDPSGRFHYRWWDGHQWTSHVSTDGHHLIDTNPDQRIGPYF